MTNDDNLEPTYGIPPELHSHEADRLYANVIPHPGNLRTKRAANINKAFECL